MTRDEMQAHLARFLAILQTDPDHVHANIMALALQNELAVTA